MKNTLIVALGLAAISLAACGKANTVTCENKIGDVAVEKKDLGAVFTVTCPGGCTAQGIWGTDVYTTDSAICTAAAHAGVIKLADGGAVKVTVVKSLPSYKGSERNGVSSSDWGSAWGDTAFSVSK